MADSLRGEVKHLGVDVGQAYFSWIGTEMVRGAEDTVVGRRMRQELRGPFAKRYPPSMAADAIIEGIERAQADRRDAGLGAADDRHEDRCSSVSARRASEDAMAEVDELTRQEQEQNAGIWEPSGAGGRAFLEANRNR